MTGTTSAITGQISQRLFAYVPTNYLTLGGGDYVRRLAIGANWFRVRIGMLCAISAPSGVNSIYGGQLAMGMCVGGKPPVGSSNTGFFVGGWNLSTTAMNWTVTQTPVTVPPTVTNPIVASATNFTIGYKRNNDWLSYVGSTSAAVRLPLLDTFGYMSSLKGANRRMPIVLDILRPVGQCGPCPAATVLMYASNTAADDDRDFTPSDLLTALDNTTAPILKNVTLSVVANNVINLPVGDATGPLDTVNIFWSKVSTPLHIYCIAAAVIYEGQWGYTNDAGFVWDNFDSYGTGTVTQTAIPNPISVYGSGWNSSWTFRSDGTNLSNPGIQVFNSGSFPYFGSQNWSGQAGTNMYPFDTFENYTVGTVTSLNTGSFWASDGTIRLYGSTFY